MSVVQGSDLGAHWAESHRLDHMMLIPRGPPVKLLVKESPGSVQTVRH